ncbi:hypothetical protein FSARC_14982, partial [Fusarium sarcochroum]
MSNATFDPAMCTVETCSVKEYGQIAYIPTFAGNVAYLAIFGALIAAQCFQGIRFKTWGFMIAMICGLLLEIVGYVGRIMLHDNIFNNDSFIIYLVGLTIGPAFITAAIYLCLGRIITIYSVDLSLLKPKWITIIFVSCDFVALLLQAAGGAITASADDEDGSQMGIDIMIAGLASQVASMGLFCGICGHFAWKVLRNPVKLDSRFTELRRSRRFRGMLFAIGLAVITILIRSIFRLIELQEGFDGKLANNELDFMILEGPMIFIGVIGLTIWHPGFALGARLWVDAGFHFLKSHDSGSQSAGQYKIGDDSTTDIMMV